MSSTRLYRNAIAPINPSPIGVKLVMAGTIRYIPDVMLVTTNRAIEL